MHLWTFPLLAYSILAVPTLRLLKLSPNHLLQDIKTDLNQLVEYERILESLDLNPWGLVPAPSQHAFLDQTVGSGSVSAASRDNLRAVQFQFSPTEQVIWWFQTHYGNSTIFPYPEALSESNPYQVQRDTKLFMSNLKHLILDTQTILTLPPAKAIPIVQNTQNIIHNLINDFLGSLDFQKPILSSLWTEHNGLIDTYAGLLNASQAFSVALLKTDTISHIKSLSELVPSQVLFITSNKPARSCERRFKNIGSDLSYQASVGFDFGARKSLVSDKIPLEIWDAVCGSKFKEDYNPDFIHRWSHGLRDISRLFKCFGDRSGEYVFKKFSLNVDRWESQMASTIRREEESQYQLITSLNSLSSLQASPGLLQKLFSTHNLNPFVQVALEANNCHELAIKDQSAFDLVFVSIASAWIDVQKRTSMLPKLDLSSEKEDVILYTKRKSLFTFILEYLNSFGQVMMEMESDIQSRKAVYGIVRDSLGEYLRCAGMGKDKRLDGGFVGLLL